MPYLVFVHSRHGYDAREDSETLERVEKPDLGTLPGETVRKVLLHRHEETPLRLCAPGVKCIWLNS